MPIYQTIQYIVNSPLICRFLSFKFLTEWHVTWAWIFLKAQEDHTFCIWGKYHCLFLFMLARGIANQSYFPNSPLSQVFFFFLTFWVTHSRLKLAFERRGDWGRRKRELSALSFFPTPELPREAQVGKSPIQILLSLFLELLKFLEILFHLHHVKRVM